MGFGFSPRRALLGATAVVAMLLGGAEMGRAQLACNVNNVALPPINLTDPGQRASVGDVVQYSFDLSAGLINPGSEVDITTIAYSLACDGAGFIVPGCPNDGGSIRYAGDGSILTDCPGVLSTDNPGGGSDAFVLTFTPPVTLVEGVAGCNVTFNGNVVSLSGDVTPLMTEGASGTGIAVCTDPGNGLNAAAFNSFSVDLQADCPVELDKCVVVDVAGDGFGNDPCLDDNAGQDGQNVQWRIEVTNPGNGPAGDCLVTDPDLGFVSVPFDVIAGGTQTFEVNGVCSDLTEGINTATVECLTCFGLAEINTDFDSANLVCNPPAMPATTPWGSALLAVMLLAALSLWTAWREPARS